MLSSPVFSILNPNLQWYLFVIFIDICFIILVVIFILQSHGFYIHMICFLLFRIIIMLMSANHTIFSCQNILCSANQSIVLKINKKLVFWILKKTDRYESEQQHLFEVWFFYYESFRNQRKYCDFKLLSMIWWSL